MKPVEKFDRLILDEQYAEAFAFAIDNKIEQEALRVCINYIQEDDERTDRELKEQEEESCFNLPDIQVKFPTLKMEKIRQRSDSAKLAAYKLITLWKEKYGSELKVFWPREIKKSRTVIADYDEYAHYRDGEAPEEKLKPGVKVKITDRIKHWVKVCPWDHEMLEDIGKEGSILKEVEYDYRSDGCPLKVYNIEGSNFNWPSDCLEIIEE